MAITIENPSAMILVVITLLLAVSWQVLIWVWLRPKKLEKLLRQQGIGGHPYKIFHGDMKEITRMRSEANSVPMDDFSHDHFPRIHPFLNHTIKNYGKTCFTWEGPIPTLHIGDAELVKEALCKNFEFQKGKVNPFISMLIKGLARQDGEKWAHHRKLINPAFHMEKLKLMLPAFYTSCGEMLNLWEAKVSNAEQEFDVCDYLVTLSADSISRAAFGSSYKEGRQIFQLLREQIFLVIKATQSVYFPGLRYLPTENNKKLKGTNREINSLLSGIINKRMKVKEEQEDLLGILMNSSLQNEGCSKKEKFRISTQEMIDECKLFYFAGQETTSTLLTWTMILLGKHQEWQSRAREEVLKTFGKTQPDFEGLNHMKIMNMIFHEVLRLYPPFIQIRRTVVDDNTKLGSLVLPRGVILDLSTIYIHHDCQVWGDDAKEFNPERFSQGISNASRGSVSFLGFGWGPRVCIGSNFAMVEAKVVLSMILQRFAFQLSPSYVHAPSAYGILHPQFGAPIIFHRL